MYLQLLVLLPLLATGMAAPSMERAPVQARDTAPSIELNYGAGLEVKDFRQLIRYAGKDDHPTPLEGIIPKDGRVTMPGLSVVEDKAGRGKRIKVVFHVEGTKGITECQVTLPPYFQGSQKEPVKKLSISADDLRNLPKATESGIYPGDPSRRFNELEDEVIFSCGPISALGTSST